MAKIVLGDGRRVTVVKPNLWDAAAVEKEMGWNRKEYAQQMKLSAMSTALAIFASLRRAGIDVTFQSVADLDNIENMVAEPGELARAEAEESAEGEESLDPPASATPADDAASPTQDGPS